MFDIVRNNKLAVQIFLGLITVPFALWGVEAYLKDGVTGETVAKVGSVKVSQAEFEGELRNQQERMQRNLGAAFDPKLMNSPDARAAVVDGLVNNRVLMQAAARARLGVSDEQLAQVISSAPVFQDKGTFSPERYQSFVRSQNLTEAAFEARLREDLIQQQWLSTLGETALVAGLAKARWSDAVLEERDLSVADLQPASYSKEVKLAGDAAKKFYDANSKHFENPERLRAEYVVLSADQFLRQVSVSDEEVKKWYDTHTDRYKLPEQRRASHILITADAKAPAAEQKAIQARAEALLAKVRANPADFAKIAKENSEDPGSKGQGGDLGFFGRGSMVKPFEDATFGLKDGEISNLVRSDFGFHIIHLTGVTPAKVKPLADVRIDIVEELKRQAAGKQYAEAVEAFNNTVFEQSDSLKPVTEKFKIPVMQTTWVVRGARGQWPLTNDKLVAALFSDDSIKNKRNTEVVDLGNNTLVAARVIEHMPAAMRPIEEVRADIEKRLTNDEAARLAQKAGEAAVVELQKGGKAAADLKWGNSQKVSRATARAMPKELAEALFKMPKDKLPSYTGFAAPDGRYLVIRLNAVEKPTDAEPAKAAALANQYQRMIAEEDLASYVKHLRSSFDVEINQAALVPKGK